MPESTDLLLNNALALGGGLLVLLVAVVVLSHIWEWLVRPLLERLQAGSPATAHQSRRISRLLVRWSMLLGLLMIAGAALLTWLEVDAWDHTRRWTESLWRSPEAIAWFMAEAVGVSLVAVLLHRGLSHLLRLVFLGLGGVLDQGRHASVLALTAARVQMALRWTFVLGVVTLVVSRSSALEALRYPITVLDFAVVGTLLARALASMSRLFANVLFDTDEASLRRNPLLRYTGQLSGIATTTRYTLEYVIYVGAATAFVGQLTPDTFLAELGFVVLRVIAILYMTRVVIEVASVAIRGLAQLRDDGVDDLLRHQRATLVPVATSLVRYVGYILGVAIALDEVGVDTTPLLAAAGLLGVAVGLGAQAIVSDLVSGFFILFEGIFLVGHRICVGEVEGEVEEIGVRITKIRDNFGVLHCIPNGEIRAVASHSSKYVNAVVEFGLPLGVDLQWAFTAISEHLAAVRSRYPDILGDTELVVEALRKSYILARAVTRVQPGKSDAMKELLSLEIVAALAAANIDPPHERHVVRMADGMSRPA